MTLILAEIVDCDEIPAENEKLEWTDLCPKRSDRNSSSDQMSESDDEQQIGYVLPDEESQVKNNVILEKRNFKT